MKVKSIEINGIGGIENINIEFNDHMNFICGPNGIGKTTLLECVAHSFSTNSTNILKRNVSMESGSFKSTIDIEGTDQQSNVVIVDFDPGKQSHINGLYQHAPKLLSLKVSRTFQYQPLAAVSKDINKDSNTSFQEAKSGVNISEVKNWFVNRYLYSAHDGALTEQQLNNLELAKRSFSLLNESFSFSKVLAASNEIMVNTPNGDIYYEYLSSGFKSCLSIIFGIIKDIEFRFKNPCINALDFDGVILIDELELHLHPEWQAKIAKILVQVFPKAQFITATHSPHILQGANPNEIIALASENGKVYRRNLDGGKYGYQGWTVEEILVDVMGMSDTRTDTYYQELNKFETAISEDDFLSAEAAFIELDSLLHPNNHMRKLLKLELASVKSGAE
ncbi:AAA family ATPase [Vibrio cholerae]|uniref:AAA family ATPase n=1 Tax=Vibrio cholerae TaxID=666 RepID=UPI000BA9CD59|nr:AAA family ATPase [Vibrio cholerae]EGQ9579584.1 AAA family ATPase [Vibrio cholerae]EGR5013219.1 recombinase RecF [Vibrio cholerae]EID7717364.1 AAA family ATPase [Vibrio cholerae]EJF7199350.1 AAA family ATPase [Vibrio cholerae]EJL6699177.1 AAA family ATPase [Vibrio cholerae]